MSTRETLKEACNFLIAPKYFWRLLLLHLSHFHLVVNHENNYSKYSSHFDQNIKDGMNILSEVPLFGGNKFIVGYVDIIVHFEDVINEHGHFKYIHKYGNVQTKYIEVKTNIKSFGQTLRQLRTYESFLPENKNKPQQFLKTKGFFNKHG